MLKGTNQDMGLFPDQYHAQRINVLNEREEGIPVYSSNLPGSSYSIPHLFPGLLSG